MTNRNGLRRFHAAVWDEPLVMQLGHPGRRGQVFPEAEPAVKRQAAIRAICARSIYIPV